METRLQGVDQMASVIAQHYQAAGESANSFFLLDHRWQVRRQAVFHGRG